jgi:hypothetical protein
MNRAERESSVAEHHRIVLSLAVLFSALSVVLIMFSCRPTDEVPEDVAVSASPDLPALREKAEEARHFAHEVHKRILKERVVFKERFQQVRADLERHEQLLQSTTEPEKRVLVEQLLDNLRWALEHEEQQHRIIEENILGSPHWPGLVEKLTFADGMFEQQKYIPAITAYDLAEKGLQELLDIRKKGGRALRARHSAENALRQCLSGEDAANLTAAADFAEGKRLLEQGSELYRAGQFAEAVPTLLRARLSFEAAAQSVGQVLAVPGSAPEAAP